MTASEMEPLLVLARRHSMLPPLDAPEWITAREKPAVRKWVEQIEKLANNELSGPMPPLTDEMYAAFFKTGERLTFESVYFDRRRILARAAIMVLCGDPAKRSAFIASLIRKIEEIMAEESWTFPAHAWTEPTGKDPMKIDLFAAETANLMGELITLFGALIPEALHGRIRERLRVQFFENYLRGHADFVWTKLPMNWNAVCHQGVLGAALAVERDTGILAAMLELAGRYLRIFVSGFGEDGSTSEGPGYWSYGFGRYAELNEQLETATGGALSLFGESGHIRRIAMFAPALVFSKNHLVNFSDGGHDGTLPAPLLGYLGKRLKFPILQEEALPIYRDLVQNGIDVSGQRCDLFSLCRLILRCPDSGAIEKAREPMRADVYFADYGAVVARGNDAAGNLWEFAAKGGHNDEHHNHNDCGSFILNLNGQPAIIEIGAPEYNRKYFGTPAERYSVLAARSLGHSVPFVNGVEQGAGAAFAALVEACELEAERIRFSVNLTNCYPAGACCRKLVRTFTFEKKAGLLRVCDSFEFDTLGTMESMLISYAPFQMAEGGVELKLPGGKLLIALSSGTSISGIEECEYSDHAGKLRKVNRLRLQSRCASRQDRVEYRLSYIAE